MTYHIPPIPHANFLNSGTLNISGTGAADTVTFDTVVDQSGITLVSTSQITAVSPGDYMFIVSAIANVTSGSNKHVELWFAKGGANVADSNTIVELPAANVEQIISVPFIIDLLAGEYIQLKWCSDSANAQLLATAAGTGPTRPACPSIIVAVNKMSE